MSFRDTQILISRQSVLLVTGVGVGLLTLAYVLGVQVGKQSAALRRPAAPTVEDELKALPEPLLDQLKLFDTTDPVPREAHSKLEATLPDPEKKTEGIPLPKPAMPSPAPKAAGKIVPQTNPELKATKPGPGPKNSPEAKETPATYNLQLVATPDPKEAERVVAKAKAAGYVTTTVQDGKLLKVRLAKPLSKGDADTANTKLLEKGLKPFTTKVD